MIWMLNSFTFLIESLALDTISIKSSLDIGRVVIAVSRFGQVEDFACFLTSSRIFSLSNSEYGARESLGHF